MITYFVNLSIKYMLKHYYVRYVYMHAYIHTHLFADLLLYDYFINLTINYHIAESFRGRTFGKFIFWAFDKKCLVNEYISQKAINYKHKFEWF